MVFETVTVKHRRLNTLGLGALCEEAPHDLGGLAISGAAIYRAGDQLSAWGYAGLAALGLALSGIAWVAVPFSAVFLALGVWLGRRQREMARDEGAGVSAVVPDRVPAAG